MIILDTDLVSLVQEQPSAARERLLIRIDIAKRQTQVVTSVITYEEQMRGWFSLLSKARTVLEEVKAYRQLRLNLDNYRVLTIVDFDEIAAVQLQRLRTSKIRIGTMDLKIAAIVLANNAVLWSRNLQHFRKVPGLRVEDATM
jgi:tRNA(fMet)-specific endonuclease VapC